MEDERNSTQLTRSKGEPRSVKEKVMHRIRREESWAYPVTIRSGASRLNGRRWIAFILSAFLLIASYLVWYTSLPFMGEGTKHSWASTLDVVVGSGDLQTLSQDKEGFSVNLDQMVAGIGKTAFLREGKKSFEIDEKAFIGAAFLLLHLYLLLVWVGWKGRTLRRS